MEPREETDMEKPWKQKILAETSLVVKNPPTNAGDRFHSWSRKIPCARKLNPWATTTEAHAP